MKKNIYLIGFMGTGKSSVAKLVAEQKALKLVEMDERLVKEAGMSINEIFAQFGEEHFRDLESALVKTIGSEGDTIVSCGGGTAMRQANVDAMRSSGTIVYLKTKPETIYERVKDSNDRPLLNGNMNVEYISELMEKRRPMYENAADITVETDGKTKLQICNEIIDKLY